MIAYQNIAADLIRSGIEGWADVPQKEREILTAHFLMELDSTEKWEFVSECKISDTLPDIIATALLHQDSDVRNAAVGALLIESVVDYAEYRWDKLRDELRPIENEAREYELAAKREAAQDVRNQMTYAEASHGE